MVRRPQRREGLLGWQVAEVAAGRDGCEETFEATPLPAAHVSGYIERCLRQGTVRGRKRACQRKIVVA
jgi:hypothetical protein